MRVSFIIPAHNEQSVLSATLERLFLSAGDCLGDGTFEVIVVDDASSDRTAAITTEFGAQVVPVDCRQIAAARNAGAKLAKGDVFIFVDADTLVPEETLAAALDAIRTGAVGGGATVRFDEDVSFVVKGVMALLVRVFVWLRLAAGCFLFSRRDVFVEVGGFDERFFASEEIWMSKALKSRGRFVIVQPPVITSGRKVRMHGLIALLWRSVVIGLGGLKAVQRREGLELWYDGRREPPRVR